MEGEGREGGGEEKGRKGEREGRKDDLCFTLLLGLDLNLCTGNYDPHTGPQTSSHHTYTLHNPYTKLLPTREISNSKETASEEADGMRGKRIDKGRRGIGVTEDSRKG